MIDEKEILIRTIKSWKQNYPFLKTFDDLIFEKHHLHEEIDKLIGFEQQSSPIFKSFTDSKQAKIRNGEDWFSVCFGSRFYSNGFDTYEVYSSKMHEPIGYIDKYEVTFEYILFQLENPKFLILEKSSIPNIQKIIENNKDFNNII